MSNYSLNNVRRFYMHITEDEYWDFYLNEDSLDSTVVDPCLISSIDTFSPLCLSGNSLTSLPEPSYPYACSNGLLLENIGYTGVDNGLFSYRKDRITNEEFYNIYTGSKYEVESGDTRLHLYQVTGNTMQYDYPVGVNDDGSIRLNGGFYQGFFRSDDKYSVLPSDIPTGSEWTLSFKLRKHEYEPESDRTLNDKYPENKGIFFYIGTRAENKFMYLYDKYELSGKTYGDCEEEEDDFFDLVDDEMVLSAQTFDTTSGIDIFSPNEDYILTDNKFLIFDRTPSGMTVPKYEGDEVVMLRYKKNRFPGNLFLYMNRTPSGCTVHDIFELESGYTETYSDQTMYSDIYDNALAFMVNDDGSIGYRYLVKDCEGEKPYKILSGSSFQGIAKEDEWLNIKVRVRAAGNKMRLMFYVNGKLKYITTELPKLNLHKLDEIDEKQEGVAYNISLGGGTQGLAEAIMPDYMLNPTKTFPLEENFAGTFIGDIAGFKFQAC